MQPFRNRSSVCNVLAVLSIISIFSTHIASAQSFSFEDSWRWAHFTTESGLPSDQVFCIAETPDSTIWAGTQKGVAWFDGYSWNSVDSTSGIPAAQISVIEPYRKDSIFCIIGGVAYLGGKNGFRLLLPHGSRPGGIQSVVLTNHNQILLLDSENLWGLDSSGLKLLPTPGHPISVGPRNLWRTSSGTVWLNTVRGLYRGNGLAWTLVIPSEGFPLNIQGVAEDRRGNGLAGITFPRELYGIREWTRGGRGHLSESEKSGGLLDLDVTPEGDVLAAYEYGEIRLRHRGAWSSVVPRPREFTSTHALKFGMDDNLWVGTEQGLFLFHAKSNRWTYWKHPFGDPRNGVHEITRTSDGSVWLGTFNGLEIHRPNGAIRYIESVLGTTLGTVTCIAEDRDHNVWVGSGANFQGAFRWDGRSWKHFGFNDGLRSDRIHKIRKDRNGDLWFLGLSANYSDARHQPGAFQYKGGKFIHWSPKDSLREGPINGRVYAFAEGFDGSRWFGTLTGISRWKDSVWTHWTERNGLQNRTGRIYTLAIDSSGSLWFSNSVNGLGSILADGSVRFLTTRDGLINDEIWDLKVDGGGALWISTKRGLSCYDKGIWSNFSVHNGLNTPNLFDLLPLKNRVYIGTPGAGVIILNRTAPSLPPRVRFGYPSFKGSRPLFRLKIFPYFGNFHAQDLEIRYRYDGNQWSEWTTERDILLPDLASGQHKFEVQGKGIIDDLSPDIESLSFDVEPGLLQRPVALLTLVLLVGSISILGGAYIRRKRKYRKALQKSDDRFHLLATTTADIIYDWNLANGELWINDPVQSRLAGPKPNLGESRELWMGRVHPEDRARLEEAMADAASTLSSDWQSEYRFLKTDGTYGHMLHRGHFEFDEGGKPVRAVGSIMDITERKQAEDLTRSISKRIIEALESERRRVSRELHDSVNQILASVKFRIESLEERLPARNKSIRTEARKTRLLLNKVMSEIRRISRNLRPAELDDIGLGSAVRSLADEFSERTKITTIVKDGWPKRTLTPELRLTLYRIIQESLTNVEKHAKAKRVRIGYSETDTEIVCTIEDNGMGIRTDERGKTRVKGGGLGLLDMQERLSFIGGTLQISSVPHRGTVVTIHIPLKKPPIQDQVRA